MTLPLLVTALAQDQKLLALAQLGSAERAYGYFCPIGQRSHALVRASEVRGQHEKGSRKQQYGLQQDSRQEAVGRRQIAGKS